ncbi:putative Xaa-Pro aminopeptidase P [Choiromyces venosus 120613-1]|uniref:Probable Xaa-Pro aminopeptidase P n=1 Tax=Choiromyces venosus 120613-1 TaxID=1336337 RepID=A0A3N4K5Q8_9PEZI|nr:putative Xaa-Pro aminopeptidase P [Choiromyces venosus 120613-1]
MFRPGRSGKQSAILKLLFDLLLIGQAEGEKNVGVDATVITSQQAKGLETRIKKKGGAGLLGLSINLIDEVWGADRPERPNNPVMVLDKKYSGKEFPLKIEAVRKDLENKKSPGFVVSMLDEIAWLFNLRGTDIPYNPVFFSYAFVTPKSTTLYIDSSKLDEKVIAHLGSAVQIRPYNVIFDEIILLAQEFKEGQAQKDLKAGEEGGKWLVSNRTSWALSKALGGEDSIEVIRSPIEEEKAVKNDTEREGMKGCHIRDGAALIEYFAWLEDELLKGTKIDEGQAADKLEQIRSRGENFMGLSFDTISSTGLNAAVIHYKPEAGNCSVIDPKAIYLCDSGAQYLDGTTDTTRTLHFGEPTEMERKSYTLVLKGMIALDRAIFPKGTSGFALDILARQFLWSEGLDYRHGTGHGVGSFLNVHEGPFGIGTKIQYSEVALSPGMFVSNEPGYYEDGSFGIRIENIIMVKEVKTNHNFGDRPYFGFERVTMVPMCRKLIDTGLLTPAETKWLNSYHAEVFDKTHEFFEEDSLALKWLRRETTPI